jgi:hypothetical protein
MRQLRRHQRLQLGSIFLLALTMGEHESSRSLRGGPGAAANDRREQYINDIQAFYSHSFRPGLAVLFSWLPSWQLTQIRKENS